MYLANLEEVRRFEELSRQYHKVKGGMNFSWVSLTSAYETLQQYDNGGRVFAALLDLRFNIDALLSELGQMAMIRNNYRQARESIQGSLLENPDFFFERLDLLRVNTSYILRYRAVLDKVMGLLVMLAAPEKYNSFAEARSRRKKFVQIAEQAPILPAKLVSHLAQTIDAFNRYRTAEAHGTGSARTWTFLDDDDIDSPQSDMFWSWNSLHPVLTLVGKLFPGRKADNEAEDESYT